MRAHSAVHAFLVVPILTLSLALGAARAEEPYRFDEATLETAHALSETALDSDLAYEITRSLTTEVGPRLAGTEQEARARDWAVAKLTELGFENVRVEPFDLDLWTRGESIFEEVSITSPKA